MLLRTLRSVAVLCIFSAPLAFGQVPAAKLQSLLPVTKHLPVAVISQITGTVDDAKRTRLVGNTPYQAEDPLNDRGPVGASFQMEHMMLQLIRTPEKEAAISAYIDTLNDPRSPNFHQWLTAKQIGSQYGPSAADTAKLTDWLVNKGMSINRVYENGMVIDFSGNEAAVENTFHTTIHKLSVGGKDYTANMSDPEIPTAFTGLVHGVVSLNSFMPHTMHKNLSKLHLNGMHVATEDMHGKTNLVQPNDTFTSGSSTYYAIVPADVQTIYRVNKMFAQGITGAGQTVIVIEDSDYYKATDISTFQSTFGLAGYGGTFGQIHPGNCTDPGDVAGTDGEVELDVEYALATAPAATVNVASCKDSGSTFGGLTAMQNLVNGANPPTIISMSYGYTEPTNGATANQAYYTAYQTGAAEGVSIFVSSGDEGAASSDANKTKATHGITVSGFASTPYNVAVGGTDFGDSYLGTNSTYWNAANTATYGSAKGYIPEIPWNDSCASVLLAKAYGYATTYGSTGFCNSSTATSGSAYLSTGSGSGGPSACATGTRANTGVSNGTCKGWPKPSYQTLVGNPADGVRDLPDVSLFAANGVWGHYYPYCYTNPGTNLGGAACTGTPDTWSGAGGTSFSSPILAAMQALINQGTGTTWGNPNTVYYHLANVEYGTTGSTNCNSTTSISGGTSQAGCYFHDVTLGDMDVNCTGTYNCYIPSGTNGVLSTSSSSYLPAYNTNVGWDFATGIGSVSLDQLYKGFLAYQAGTI